MPRPVSAAGAAARVGAPHTARAYLRLQFLAGRVLPVVIDGAVRQTGEHVHRRRRAQQPRGIAATSSGNSSSNRDAFVAELQTAPLPYLATFVTPLPPDLSSGIAAASSWPPPSSVVTLQVAQSAHLLLPQVMHGCHLGAISFVENLIPEGT